MISWGAYSQAQIFPEDLDIIVGEWEGSLTYLDYQTGNPYTMPANALIENGKNEYTLLLKNIYPNEPKANSKEKIKMSKDGSRLNKHDVTSRVELENGDIQIQTKHEGKDDRKSATIRYTYTFGENAFIIQKEVQFSDSEVWIKRNEYNYVR